MRCLPSVPLRFNVLSPPGVSAGVVYGLVAGVGFLASSSTIHRFAQWVCLSSSSVALVLPWWLPPHRAAILGWFLPS